MATIRVHDWTKEQIETIRDSESHSSYDSVIKSLLKDRQLAKLSAGSAAVDTGESATETTEQPDKALEDLTVLNELSSVDNGVLFLWCPNCGNEIAHLSVENPVGISIFETECQRCLTHLDQHALIGIEIGYPIEERHVEGTLDDDLKSCVIDYWDRSLEDLADGTIDADTDVEQLIWQFGQYVREFNWDWPSDVPVVGFEVGYTYRNEATGELVEVIEPAAENRNSLNTYKVRRYAVDDTPDEVEPIILNSNTIANLILSRELRVETPVSQSQ